MSGDAAPITNIPARVTVEELALALDVDVSAVRAVLAARNEPSSPADIVGSDEALAVAGALGIPVSIEARDLALETLYQAEIGGEIADVAGMKGRVGFLVKGVLEHKENLDHEIESASEHWSVARMPIIDRSTAVVVSEAVRLARTYSTERSGSFVNGVLASLARAARS
jgi:N utilization substance protein B